MTARLVAAFLVAAVILNAAPGIDLWVSEQFFNGERFPLRRSDALESIRNQIWLASILVALAGLALWAVWRTLGDAAEVPARLWGWIAAVYLAGPGLLVNGLLKEHWGRARPHRVFADKAEFTRAFEPADQCWRNCSFVSGEAAGAAAMAIVLGALAWRWRWRPGRIGAATVLGAVALTASVLRVATGRHFLSDIVFAWFFTAFVALWLWHLMQVGPARDALSVRALRADVRTLAGRVARLWRRVRG